MSMTSAGWIGVRQSTLVTVFLSYLVLMRWRSWTSLCSGWRGRPRRRRSPTGSGTFTSRCFSTVLWVFKLLLSIVRLQFAAGRHFSSADELGHSADDHLPALSELQGHRCQKESLGWLRLLCAAGRLAGRSHRRLCHREVIYCMSRLSAIDFIMLQ